MLKQTLILLLALTACYSGVVKDWEITSQQDAETFQILVSDSDSYLLLRKPNNVFVVIDVTDQSEIVTETLPDEFQGAYTRTRDRNIVTLFVDSNKIFKKYDLSSFEFVVQYDVTDELWEEDYKFHPQNIDTTKIYITGRKNFGILELDQLSTTYDMGNGCSISDQDYGEELISFTSNTYYYIHNMYICAYNFVDAQLSEIDITSEYRNPIPFGLDKLIFEVSGEDRLIVFDVDSGDVIFTYQFTADSSPQFTALSRDERYMVMGTEADEALVLDSENYCRYTFIETELIFNGFDTSSDFSKFYIIARDGTVEAYTLTLDWQTFPNCNSSTISVNFTNDMRVEGGNPPPGGDPQSESGNILKIFPIVLVAIFAILF